MYLSRHLLGRRPRSTIHVHVDLNNFKINEKLQKKSGRKRGHGSMVLPKTNMHVMHSYCIVAKITETHNT